MREGERERERERESRRVRELLGMIFNTLYANEATVYRKHAAERLRPEEGSFASLVGDH